MGGIDILKSKIYHSKCAATSTSPWLVLEPWNEVLRHGYYKNSRTGEIIKVLDGKVDFYGQWSDAGEILEVKGMITWTIERGCDNTQPQTISNNDEFRFVEWK